MNVQARPVSVDLDLVLRTGRTFHVRPLETRDRAAVDAFLAAIPDAVVPAAPLAGLDEQPEGGADGSPEGEHRRGVVGEINGQIAAVGWYSPSAERPHAATVSLTISPAFRGKGMATSLVDHLVRAARESGVDFFEADVDASNDPMLDVLLSSGLTLEVGSREGMIHASLGLEPTTRSAQRSAERAEVRARASLRPIFAPRSIAVVGASRQRGSFGAETFHNLMDGGFKGRLYAVNPAAGEIEGAPCHRSLHAIGEPVDLAIIAVPGSQVESVIDDCIEVGVSAAVIISAGFGETGEPGLRLEQRLLEKARRAGMRLVGPNCMGVVNTDPAVSMHGTFAAVNPLPGNIAMSSESGALGLAVLDYARSLEVGFSSFISIGNRIDVSGNDLLQYWANDDATDVILLYLESFGNPRRFAEIARRVSRRKPIIAVKSGRSGAGARAARSHTGALMAADRVVADLFRQSGIIRSETLEGMFDVAMLLAQQPIPPGPRVGILTNAGGAGILAADACEARGLTLPDPSPSLASVLRTFLPPAATIGNPVDMIASASAEDYRRALGAMLEDSSFDSILVIYIPVTPRDLPDVARVIRECGAATNGKTVLATCMGAHGEPLALAPVPSFPFPERAVQALSHATEHGAWLRRPVGRVPELEGMDGGRARGIVEQKLREGGGWLDPLEAADLLGAVGIEVPPADLVTDAEEAMEAAMRIGGAVAVKAVGPDLLHKSDSGGVLLDVRTECEAGNAWDDLAERLGDRMTGALVQQMVPGGIEAMIGATQQSVFGHVLACGAGGTLVELLDDVAFRLHPLTDEDARSMVMEPRFSRLLTGFRGGTPGDAAALTDALLRLSALLTACPEVVEVEINPLKIFERGVIAVDYRVRVEPGVAHSPPRGVTY